jgi:hypothetical protein
VTVVNFPAPKPAPKPKRQPPSAPRVFTNDPIGWAIRRETHSSLAVRPVLHLTRKMIYLGYYQSPYNGEWMWRKHYPFEVLARFATKAEADEIVARFQLVRDAYDPQARELRKRMDALVEERRLAINAAAKAIGKMGVQDGPR